MNNRPVFLPAEVLFNDIQADDGSTVDSLLRSSPLLWPPTLDPDWTTAPLLWRRLLLSWTPGRKSSPCGAGRCWEAVVSRRPGCGWSLEWDPRYQQPRRVRRERQEMKPSLLALVWSETQTELFQSHILDLCMGAPGHFVWMV